MQSFQIGIPRSLETTMTQTVLGLAWASFPKLAIETFAVLGSDPSSGTCSYSPLAPLTCLAAEMNLVVTDVEMNLLVAAAEFDVAQLNLEILLLAVESEQQGVLN